jgi:hypothetical protein
MVLGIVVVKITVVIIIVVVVVVVIENVIGHDKRLALLLLLLLVEERVWYQTTFVLSAGFHQGCLSATPYCPVHPAIVPSNAPNRSIQ